ncbi:MAG: hypothetical protein IAF94_18545 [Pirellulaceae bacterium]|nr:hypothetical protein [Pirellulaceae bacterium]
MHGPTIRCQVLEVPTLDDTTPRDEGTWPRDLLPWADPYIASLMMKLQGRVSGGGLRARGATERLLDDDFTLDQFAAEQWLGEDGKSEADANWPDLAPRNEFPPIYGGFRLLDDD